jgi:3-oxoacyl-[acyl-carrier protein] reductase
MAGVAMTRVLAVDLAPRSIRVNAIAAGLIDTEGTRGSGFMGSDAQKALVSTIPLARAGTPEDIADVALFLSGAAARYVTGKVLFVDGGAVAVIYLALTNVVGRER